MKVYVIRIKPVVGKSYVSNVVYSSRVDALTHVWKVTNGMEHRFEWFKIQECDMVKPLRNWSAPAVLVQEKY